MKLSLLLLLSFRLFLSVTATATTATAAVAAGSEVASEEVIRVLRKYAKKTTAHVDEIKDSPVCSIDRFPRVSKYQNCQGVESVVDILCAVPPRRRTCKYTEHYINRKGEACLVEGSFDPIAQIGTDPARPDVCHLDFVSLKDSCHVDATSAGLFGMTAEVHMRSTGPAEADEEACTRSLMRLRFSVTGGAEYYNDETPRTAMAVECALPTPHTKQDTLVRSAPLVKTTAVVAEERRTDLSDTCTRFDLRPTQCEPVYAPIYDNCYTRQEPVDRYCFPGDPNCHLYFCWYPKNGDCSVSTFGTPDSNNGTPVKWTLTTAGHDPNNCGSKCTYMWDYYTPSRGDKCYKKTDLNPSSSSPTYCWYGGWQGYPESYWNNSYYPTEAHGDNNCGSKCG